MTPVVELVWTKRRIVEVYLNVAETGKGAFGAEAAARRYFGKSWGRSERHAGRADRRRPARPQGPQPGAALRDYLRKRARSIADGAATIRADGRAACFED